MAKGKYQKWLTPDGKTLLEAWARDGLTDKQISHNMGINKATLYRWKREHCDICNALSRGKEIVDVEVENDLLKKAHGYNAQIRKTFKVKEVFYDEAGHRCEKEHLEDGIDEVHVPADTQAITFWLRNRRPDKWRDKVDTSAPDQQETQDDGFLEALEQKAPEVWPSADPEAEPESEPEEGAPDGKQ